MYRTLTLTSVTRRVQGVSFTLRVGTFGFNIRFGLLTIVGRVHRVVMFFHSGGTIFGRYVRHFLVVVQQGRNVHITTYTGLKRKVWVSGRNTLGCGVQGFHYNWGTRGFYSYLRFCFVVTGNMTRLLVGNKGRFALKTGEEYGLFSFT